MPTVLESLNAGLHQAFAASPLVYLIGEDILDPYGGAFKASRGLSSAFAERVLTTPISEAGITGVAAGMALRGLRPVVEIMFGDFTTLIADQLINHLTKFTYMYNGQVSVPLVIRTPMGGRRGYGPTHSQSLEKIYMGISGLQMLAPTSLGDPGKLLLDAILLSQDPVLFIENKLMYAMPVHEPASLPDFEVQTVITHSGGVPAPTYLLKLHQAPAACLTITAYGYMAELARQAALRLAYEHEIFTELVMPTRLTPFEIDPLIDSLRRTGRLLVVEEGTLTLGWGAEVLARSLEALGAGLQDAARVAAMDMPIPASTVLEESMLPSLDQIVQSAIKLTQKR